MILESLQTYQSDYIPDFHILRPGIHDPYILPYGFPGQQSVLLEYITESVIIVESHTAGGFLYTRNDVQKACFSAS